jgi:glycosyltransferase involved in cell wall biosynthesis
MGQRPADLRRGLESVRAQEGVTTDIVVVGNGWVPVDLPEGVRGHALPENVGIPAGRNAGVPEVSGELLFFLDDDAALASPDTLARFAALFAARREVGLIQPRVEDPAGRPAPGRWVPRLRTGDPAEPGPATSLWEGAVAIRRTGDYSVDYFLTSLESVAANTKPLPKEYLKGLNDIDESFKNYARPLMGPLSQFDRLNAPAVRVVKPAKQG